QGSPIRNRKGRFTLSSTGSQAPTTLMSFLRSFPDERALEPRLQRQRLRLPPQSNGRKAFPEALPSPSPSPLEPTARVAPPWLILRNRPEKQDPADNAVEKLHRMAFR